MLAFFVYSLSLFFHPRYWKIFSSYVCTFFFLLVLLLRSISNNYCDIVIIKKNNKMEKDKSNSPRKNGKGEISFFHMLKINYTCVNVFFCLFVF